MKKSAFHNAGSITETLSCKRQAGFSLVELSAIIAVAAIMAVGYISWTMPATQNNALKSLETYKRLRIINDAIENFVALNQRLPCPANPTLNAQKHNNANTNAPNLYDFDDEALTVDNNGVRCPVPIGAVPTRALGIPAELMFDGWGKKFRYHVASDLCGSTDCTTRSYKAGITTPSGGLSVKNSLANNGVYLAQNTAAFVLLSVGTNGIGGYLPSGSRIPPREDKTGNSPYAEEIKNTNNDYTLNNGNTLYIKHAATALFDDLVIYRTRAQLESLVNAATPADYLTCRNNSVALGNIDRSVADTLKTQIPTLEETYGDIKYNTGDAAVLEVMWNLQEACAELYGGSLALTCPAGMAYNSFTNNCSCPKGTWNATTCM